MSYRRRERDRLKSLRSHQHSVRKDESKAKRQAEDKARNYERFLSRITQEAFGD